MSKGRILSKSPCNADLFEGKAHEKLAKTIADEIVSDENCTIIGIDGGWGSGKSNLVGMVEKCLAEGNSETKDKYHFFTYDAWGHQNDLPRRSILEELTSDITQGPNALLAESTWKQRLDNLIAKRKKTKTKTVPSLNFAIVTIALMTAFTPMINAIAEKFPSQLGRLIFTITIYLIPIVIIVCNQIRSLKMHGQEINCENFFTELFLLYKDKVTENEKFETISEREPSTKQFKDWMNDINKDIKSKDKHLVIVFDNMDRLPKQKVQELWSAIHSFFSETFYSNIKVIVPFDRQHIRNAFQSENIADNDKNKVKVYGDDFINKTFYIVYHVAPPILSGWKQYFEYQWNNAFGYDYPLDNAVLQIYDMMTEEHSPRKIVAFINEFVTIKSICDDSIPERYIALFIFGRSEISEKPMEQILSPSYLGSLEFMYKEDKEMAGYMSSLFYQLPVNDAIDIIYSRHFTKELDENNPESIKQMRASGNAKFFAILDRAIAQVNNTENAAIALQTVFENETNSQIQNLWECLYVKDKVVREEISKYVPYHKVILSHIHDKSEYINELISAYLAAFKEESDINEYINGIDDLAEVEDVDLYSMLENLHNVVSPEQFVVLVKVTKKEYKRYGLYCNDATLSDFMSNQDVNFWKELTILPYLDRKEYPLGSFKSKIEDGLKANNLSVETAKILFARLKEIKTDSRINYKDYFQNNILDNLFHNAKDEFRYDLIAMRLSAFADFAGSNNFLNSYLNTNIEEDVIEVAKVSNRYVCYGDLLLHLDRFHNPFVKALCKYHTLNRIGMQVMSIALVAKKFDIILDNSDISASELFTRMNCWNSFMDEIKESDIEIIPISFFESAIDTECELSSYVLKLATNYLKSISQDEWMSYLETDDNMQFNLIKLYHPEKIQPFFDAFKTIMKSYANGVSAECLDKTQAESIIGICIGMSHDVKRLFMDIRDIFLNSSITIEKLKYFGNWLFKYANLDHKAGCLDKILPSELLDDNDIILMMEQNKDVVKGMVEYAADTSEFTSKLESMLKGNKKNNDNLKSLCAFLDIEIGETK